MKTLRATQINGDRVLSSTLPGTAGAKIWWDCRWMMRAVMPIWLATTGCGQSPASTQAPAAGVVPTVAAGKNEPSAPDVLDVVVQGSANAAGNLTFEAIIKPTIDATAELEIDDPGGAKLESGERTKQFSLRKGGGESRERVQVNVADGKPRTVRVRLRLLGADGKPWMIIERELKMNQPPENAGVQKRVPVVHTLPDGTRIVEYLTIQEAVARGLPAVGKPARPSPAPPADEKREK